MDSKKKVFFCVLLSIMLLLTGCFGSDSQEAEKGDAKVESKQGLKCTYKADDESVGISETQVVFDYNDDATIVTKYTKVESVNFKEEYSDFVEITKTQFENSCDTNMENFDKCEVTTDGMKVILTGSKDISSDMEEEIAGNVFAKTKRTDAKTEFEKAGYTCE